MGQPTHLKKMTSVRGRDRLAQRNQAFQTLIRLLFNKFNNRNYVDPLGSNKPGPFKALIGPKTPAGLETPVRPPQAPPFAFQDPGPN